MGATNSITPIQNKEEAVLPELNIKTQSWTKESHGLFEYDTKDLETMYFKLKGCQLLKRHEFKVTVEKIKFLS